MALEPGQKAPDFTLPDQHGNRVSLSGLQGKTVVLYFYPKADTPGCTTQACGSATIGRATSRRTRWSWACRPIRSSRSRSSTRSLASASHCYPTKTTRWRRRTECGSKERYGRTYMGNERTTFVIGPDGTIRDVFRNVKPAGHDDLVLGALAGS